MRVLGSLPRVLNKAGISQFAVWQAHGDCDRQHVEARWLVAESRDIAVTKTGSAKGGRWRSGRSSLSTHPEDAWQVLGLGMDDI